MRNNKLTKKQREKLLVDAPSHKVLGKSKKELRQTLFALEYVANGFIGHLAASEVRKQYPKTKDIDDSKNKEANKKLANRYLKKELVKGIIDREVKCRLNRLGVTADWVWSRYMAWANLDISTILAIKQIETKGRIKQIVVLKKNIKDLPIEVRTAITSISLTPSGDVKVEFVNQKAALDQLCKLMNIGNETLNVNTGQIELHFDKQDDGA